MFVAKMLVTVGRGAGAGYPTAAPGSERRLNQQIEFNWI
jgi:hypothetical protein